MRPYNTVIALADSELRALFDSLLFQSNRTRSKAVSRTPRRSRIRFSSRAIKLMSYRTADHPFTMTAMPRLAPAMK